MYNTPSFLQEDHLASSTNTQIMPTNYGYNNYYSQMPVSASNQEIIVEQPVKRIRVEESKSTYTEQLEKIDRMKINDAIDEGIKRFYLQVAKGAMSIPSRQEIESNPEVYYPLLCKILECYGCKYHDNQATVCGRGATTTLIQKLDGNEKQWRRDQISPEFTELRKAWRRLVYSYWPKVAPDIPFPDDLRHYKYYRPIHDIVVSCDLKEKKVTNVMVLLKALGKFELEKPFYHAIKSGHISHVKGINIQYYPLQDKDKQSEMFLISFHTPPIIVGRITNNINICPNLQLVKNQFNSSSNILYIFWLVGISNSYTGLQGQRDAENVLSLLSTTLGINHDNVMFLSCGIPFVPINYELIFQSFPLLVNNLRSYKSEIPKDISIIDSIHPSEFVITMKLLNSDYDFTIAGICNLNNKCIKDINLTQQINLIIITDARVSQEILSSILSRIYQEIIDAIQINGEVSPNDVVLLISTGASNIEINNSTEIEQITTGMLNVCEELILNPLIIHSTRKIITIEVIGVVKYERGRELANKIASDSLLKSILTQKKPKFPYEIILNLIGSSFNLVHYDLNRITLSLKDDTKEVIIFTDGNLLPEANWLINAREIMSSLRYTIRIKLSDEGMVVKAYCRETPIRSIKKLYSDEMSSNLTENMPPRSCVV